MKGKLASCRCCGETVPPGEGYGRVELIARGSERREPGGVRGKPERRAVVAATLCRGCMEEVAEALSAQFGLDRRDS